MPTSRTASAAAIAYVQEELARARTASERIKRSVVQAMRLIQSSGQRDHFYAVAGDLIYDVPKAMQDLESALDTAAMAVNKIDYEELRQVIRPDKVDELEAVLEEVRLRVPRRTGRLPSETPNA